MIFLTAKRCVSNVWLKFCPLPWECFCFHPSLQWLVTAVWQTRWQTWMLERNVQGHTAHLPPVWHCQSLSHPILLHASSWGFACLALAVRPEHVFRGSQLLQHCFVTFWVFCLCLFGFFFSCGQRVIQSCGLLPDLFDQSNFCRSQLRQTNPAPILWDLLAICVGDVGPCHGKAPSFPTPALPHHEHPAQFNLSGDTLPLLPRPP